MPTNTIPKKVVLRGNPFVKEGKAGGAILPGHLIDWDGSGDLVVHGTAGGNASAMFAETQDYIGGGLDKAYADDDNVKYIVAQRGDEIYALLKAGENVAKGDFLESAGDGSLRKMVSQAVALKAWADAHVHPVTTTDHTHEVTVSGEGQTVNTAADGGETVNSAVPSVASPANVTVNKVSVVCRALEALNNSGATNLRIRVEVQ